MADAKTFVANAPAWVDLSSKDAAGSREFYSKLFGWQVEVQGPGSGGYALARIGGKDIAGIGPAQDPNAPTAWNVYIGTRDAEAVARKVEAAGGKVVVAPFDVLEQGRMAVFQDPAGAFISVWQPKQMVGSEVMGKPNTYGWAELNARGIGKATAFYKKVFDWGTKVSPMGEGQGDYTEFQLDGESIAGGMEMNPMVPQEVPSYWMAYFIVADVDAGFRKAIGLGAREMLAPQDFPGGRFAIVSDPQGGTFGLMSMSAQQS